MLNVSNVMFSYGTNTVLADCSLSIAPGEVVGLIGRNGAGKSTLMKLITGQLVPERGTISINGAPPDSKQARTITMFTGSNDYLPDFMTGYEYLTMLASLYSLPLHHENVESYYGRYGMTGRTKNLIEDYSHGMRKKLQLISSFVFRRPLTLIDETLNGIDVDAVLETQKDVRHLTDKSGSVLLCSHDFSYLEKVCSRVVMLDSGSIIDSISSVEYTNKPGYLETWARGFIIDDTSEVNSIWVPSEN